MQSVSYKVASLDYTNEEKIQEAIFPIFGVNRVKLTKENNELTIQYDEDLVSEESIFNSLKDMGFRIKE